MSPDLPHFLTVAFYKFAQLDNYVDMRPLLLEVCHANNVKGLVVLAKEGINGTISGPAQGIRSVLDWLRSDPRLSTLEHKEAINDKHSFYRMKVRLRREIVTMGIEGIKPLEQAGDYVSPQEWNALIQDPDVVVVDVRNDYEVDVGTFAGAINPKTRTFRDFPKWVEDNLDRNKNTKVAMFCTGGIRCEKSTAYLRQQGFDQVYHLQGGILKYLETIPEQDSLWQGECFVFDERVAVKHGLEVGTYTVCRSCRQPLSPQNRLSPHYVKGISCEFCYATRTPEQKKKYAERQRQVELALQRAQAHLGQELNAPQID